MHRLAKHKDERCVTGRVRGSTEPDFCIVALVYQQTNQTAYELFGAQPWPHRCRNHIVNMSEICQQQPIPPAFDVLAARYESDEDSDAEHIHDALQPHSHHQHQQEVPVGQQQQQQQRQPGAAATTTTAAAGDVQYDEDAYAEEDDEDDDDDDDELYAALEWADSREGNTERETQHRSHQHTSLTLITTSFELCVRWQSSCCPSCNSRSTRVTSDNSPPSLISNNISQGITPAVYQSKPPPAHPPALFPASLHFKSPLPTSSSY